MPLIALNDPRKTLLVSRIALNGFQRLFLMILFGSADVRVEVFAGFVKLVRIGPQWQVVTRAVVEFAQHCVGLPFQRELRAERHVRVAVKLPLALDQLPRGRQQLDLSFEPITVEPAAFAEFVSQLLKEMIKQHRMGLMRISITHLRVERLYILAFRVEIFGGANESCERVGKRLHPRFIVSCEDFQLLNTETAGYPAAVKVIFQSGLACDLAQQLRKRVLHCNNPPYVLLPCFS